MIGPPGPQRGALGHGGQLFERSVVHAMNRDGNSTHATQVALFTA